VTLKCSAFETTPASRWEPIGTILVCVRSGGATQKQSLEAVGLAELDRQAKRKLTQILVAERGIRVTRVQPRNESDDLHTEAAGLWRPRPGIVRLVHRSLSDADVEALAEVARSEALAEAVLIEGAQGDLALASDPAVQVIRAEALVERIKSSALIEWKAGRPRPSTGRFELAKSLNEVAPSLDPVGLRWLPTLAFNQAPPELERAGRPDELFEQIGFRLLTSCLRLGGRRLGARHRGERVPDAVLHWANKAALLDCKAARYGYQMDIGDQRALVEYARGLRPEEESAGFDLGFVVVISGDFDGRHGETHPYFLRAQAFEREAQARLVYLRAADLVRLAIKVESAGADPADREAIDWSDLFSQGMPTSDAVLGAWEES
jgi:hypothetical protein